MKYREILEQLITEINMSPSSLRSLAANIDARAGMEFEMIVPNVAGDDDDYDPEPDFDQDERARSFDNIQEFFRDGEYNSRRDAERLYDELLENYLDSDWLSEKKREAWEEASFDAIKDLVERDYYDDFYEQAVEELKEKTPEFGVNDEEFRAQVNARAKELFDEKVDEILADMGPEYDEAYEEWGEEQWPDIWNDSELQEEWLEEEGISTMADVLRNYDITWPHYNDQGGRGETDIEEVAYDFKQAIGRPVNWSRNYHGGKRAENTYVVEPDGSLDADDPSDTGLEFVSPPLPISELLSDLRLVKDWAGRTGCYTNDSTGLHINVSVPGFSNDKLDFVKLAILLGDDYILNEFGRQGNTYCKSALGIVKSHIQQRPEDAAALLNKMKEHLNTAAAKVIHSGATNKYTSINTKDGYIEFRSPGGDWLDSNFDKIENTLLRFVVALDAAIDETKYKEEYAKKLYKLLEPSNDNSDTLQYFARFSAGELPKSALASFVRQAQLQRKLKKGPTGAKYWWSVGRPGYFASVEVVAASREEAIEKGKQEYPDWRNSTNMTAKPLRPYQEPQSTGAAGPTLNGRPSNPDGNYVIVDTADEQTPVYRYMAANGNDALLVLRQWISANPGTQWNFKFDPTQLMGQPRAQSARGQQRFTGQWDVKVGDVVVFRVQAETQGEANNKAREWLSQRSPEFRQEHQGGEVTVTPRYE